MQGREILLGVTGGIAAFKTAQLASSMVQDGAHVTVVMTRAAHKFIGGTTFEALTGRPVYTDLFRPKRHFLGAHIGLARRADLYVIAPASADVLARIAHGLADDLVTTLALTVACPILVAPAMNSQMWAKSAVQRNVRQLQEDGIRFVGPDEGWLSCQTVGPGRMAEPVTILEAIRAALQ